MRITLLSHNHPKYTVHMYYIHKYTVCITWREYQFNNLFEEDTIFKHRLSGEES